MHAARQLLTAITVFLFPGLVCAQYMRSDTPPQRPGYPTYVEPPAYPPQSIQLPADAVQRHLDLARALETSERNAFQRVYSVQHSVRDNYLRALSYNSYRETPPVTPRAVEPPPSTERREMRSLRSDFLQRFGPLRETDPALREELDRRWEEFQREILRRDR